jgi:hypothetical protein
MIAPMFRSSVDRILSIIEDRADHSWFSVACRTLMQACFCLVLGAIPGVQEV